METNATPVAPEVEAPPGDSAPIGEVQPQPSLKRQRTREPDTPATTPINDKITRLTLTVYALTNRVSRNIIDKGTKLNKELFVDRLEGIISEMEELEEED